MNSVVFYKVWKTFLFVCLLELMIFMISELETASVQTDALNTSSFVFLCDPLHNVFHLMEVIFRFSADNLRHQPLFQNYSKEIEVVLYCYILD